MAGETEEGPVGELKIPFYMLPALRGIPPVAGEGKGTMDGGDGAPVWPGQEGNGMGMMVVWFTGNMNWNSGATALQWQGRWSAVVFEG